MRFSWSHLARRALNRIALVATRVFSEARSIGTIRNERRPRTRDWYCVAAEIQLLEARALLSAVLTDTTPFTVRNVFEGTSTGNVVLATFHESATYVTIDPPGSTNTLADGISGRNIIGDYADSTGTEHGFLYNGTTYTTLDPKGSTGTQAVAISGNNVAGDYADANQIVHAFLFNGSTYTTIDPPGSTGTFAVGVSGGSVVGEYWDGKNVAHGFLWNGTTYTTIDPPGSSGTYAAIVAGSNVYGTFNDSKNITHGFVFNGSTYTTLDPPGAKATQVFVVSGNNVYGDYDDATGVTHAFAYNGSTYTTLDPAGTTGTFAAAASGANLVGSFIDSSQVYHGFLYDGSTFTRVDLTGSTLTRAYAVSGSNVVGSYQDSTGQSHGFLYLTAESPSELQPIVDWVGSSKVNSAASVQLVSQSATGSDWQVVGNATYTQNGTFAVSVTVGDDHANVVKTSHSSFKVASFDGEYAVATQGSNTVSLASITQIGPQLTLVGSSTTTATITNATQLLVGGTDVAAYASGSITFSTGTFAGQVWTKLVLPTNFTNPAGAVVQISQTGAGVTFTDKFGNTTTGSWISPTKLSAWNETVTVGTGQLIWSDGTIWNEDIVIQGTNNGSGTTMISAVPSKMIVTDYTTSHGNVVHIVQTGTTNVVFIDSKGHMALGTYLNAVQASSADYPGDTATFTGNQVIWKDGAVWTETTVPMNSITVTDYTSPKGIPVHVVENGTNTLVFVDGLGNTSLGAQLTATTGSADLYPGDIATFSSTKVTWQDGTIWTRVDSPPLLITVTDSSGAVSHVQLLTPTTFVGLNGPLQGVTGTRANGKITWSNGVVWQDFDLDALTALFEMGTGFP